MVHPSEDLKELVKTLEHKYFGHWDQIHQVHWGELIRMRNQMAPDLDLNEFWGKGTAFWFRYDLPDHRHWLGVQF